MDKLFIIDDDDSEYTYWMQRLEMIETGEESLSYGREAVNPAFAIAALGGIVGIFITMLIAIFKKDDRGNVPGVDPTSAILKSVAVKTGQPNIKIRELADKLESLETPPNLKVGPSYAKPDSYQNLEFFVLSCDEIFMFYSFFIKSIIDGIVKNLSAATTYSFNSLEEAINALLGSTLSDKFFKIKKVIDSKDYYSVSKDSSYSLSECTRTNGIVFDKDKIISTVKIKLTGDSWAFDKEMGLSWFNILSMKDHGFSSVGYQPSNPLKVLSDLKKAVTTLQKTSKITSEYNPDADVLKYFPEINKIIKLSVALARNGFKGRCIGMSLMPIREIANYANMVQKEFNKEKSQ